MAPLAKRAASPQGLLAFHPLANMFPLMEGAEFKELVADIAKNGLKEKITTYQGKILDGRNRYRACLSAKVEPQFEEFKGNDAAAAAFVISKNIRRRHLTGGPRRDLIAKLLKAQPETSDRHIADMTNSSPTTVGAVRRETGSTVQSGQLPPKRIGKDGRARRQPAKKKVTSTRATTALSGAAPAAPAPAAPRRQSAPSAPRLDEQRAERLAADARYAGDLVTHNREAASWLLRVLQDDDRREIVETSPATALRNTITATPTPMGNAENTATGNDTDPATGNDTDPGAGNDTDPAESAETRKAQYAATEDGGETPAAAEIQPAAPEIPPTAPEIPPAESLLRGYADPGPIPEGLLREPAAPAPSRTSQAAK